MKQYTDAQPARLIEMGFPAPKSVSKLSLDMDTIPSFAYSIGELIEMLPKFSNIYDLTNLHTMKRYWYVGHISTLNVCADELIDALYNMIVNLKEEGVI